MSVIQTPRSLGRGAEEWSRHDTYATHKTKWDRIWGDIQHCQIQKNIGPLGCWEIEPIHCRDHVNPGTYMDYQQDGRYRMRIVVPTGLSKPRQKNVRLPILVYLYFLTKPEFRPLAENKDSAGLTYEYSHLCHNPFCIRPEHCTYETKQSNQGRDWYDRDICQGRHSPQCVTSAAEKQWGHDHSRQGRTGLRTEPWKRGCKPSADASPNKRKKPDSDQKQQTITRFTTPLSPN